MQHIFAHSAGLPSEACILADNALLLAFLHQQPQVTPAFVTLAIADRVKNVGKLDKEGKTVKKKPAPAGDVTQAKEGGHDQH